jgi:hypothetical protein
MLQREKDCTRDVTIHVTIHEGGILSDVYLCTLIDGGLNLSEYLTNKNIKIISIHQTSWFGSRLSEYLDEPRCHASHATPGKLWILHTTLECMNLQTL